MIIRGARPHATDHPEDPASCKWSSGGSGRFANDLPDDLASRKWSFGGSCLLQMIIWRDWPLANDHLSPLPGSGFNLADLSRTIRSCYNYGPIKNKRQKRAPLPSNMSKWKALIIKSNLGFLRNVHLGKKWHFYRTQVRSKSTHVTNSLTDSLTDSLTTLLKIEWVDLNMQTMQCRLPLQEVEYSR